MSKLNLLVGFVLGFALSAVLYISDVNLIVTILFGVFGCALWLFLQWFWDYDDNVVKR